MVEFIKKIEIIILLQKVPLLAGNTFYQTTEKHSFIEQLKSNEQFIKNLITFCMYLNWSF